MPDDTAASVARITKYLADRAGRPLNQLGDSIHSIHGGFENGGADLMLSDLRAIRPLLEQGMAVVEAARAIRDIRFGSDLGNVIRDLAIALAAFDAANQDSPRREPSSEA